jgi:hypothetical protein
MSLTALNTIVGSAMLTISLLGQAPAQTKPSPDAGTPLIVVGCLKKWEPAMAGRQGIPNPAKLEYVLTDIAPGTTATPAMPNVLRYLVKAKDSSVALTPHVNHRVEVSGVVTGLSEVNPTANPAANPSMTPPTLTVATVKMVSTECLGSGGV